MNVRGPILAFAITAPILAAGALAYSVPLGLAILFTSHALVLYPTLRPGCQWFGPVVTRFETSEKEVWLTIDDGPDPVDTPQILDLLDRFDARATFFVKGTRVEEYPEEARRILARGHTLGNHSHTHPSGTFWCLPPGRIAVEIDRCSDQVESVTGRTPTMFRAPVGFKNPFVHPILARRDIRLVGWSARGFDAVRKDADGILRSILRDVEPGAIILAHEGRTTEADKTVNLEVLETLLRTLTDEGYRFVIPSEDRLLASSRRNTKR